jgi:hypothetical protein
MWNDVFNWLDCVVAYPCLDGQWNCWNAGRSTLGWFIIATLASPLVAGLLVTVLPPGMNDETNHLSAALLPEPLLPPSRGFQPEGAYGNIPYRVSESGTIDVLMAGKVLRYTNLDQFLMAVRR